MWTPIFHTTKAHCKGLELKFSFLHYSNSTGAYSQDHDQLSGGIKGRSLCSPRCCKKNQKSACKLKSKRIIL